MIRRFASTIARLTSARSGNVTILMAIGAPVLIAAAGFGIDTAQWYMWKREMQYAADQAAIGAAWSMAKGISKTAWSDHAKQEFAANLAATRNFAALPTVTQVSYNGGTNNAIQVIATATRKLPFFGFVTGKATTVRIGAQASFAKGATYTACMIATNGTADGAITIGGSAILKSGCGLAALSNSTNAIRVSGSPSIDVNYVMAAGGIDDWFNTNTDDVVREYMTTLSDPFRALTPPNDATAQTYACKKTGNTTQATLNPGTYTSISTACTTFLNDGVYVIDGGQFSIRSQDVVTGNSVIIVLKNGASLKLNGGSAINLTGISSNTLIQKYNYSAANAALLDGMLVFEDRNSVGSTSTMNGNSSSVINGTVYLPKSTINFGGTARTTSRCLQITANMISIQGNTNMSNFCPPGLTTTTSVGTDAPKVILVS